MILTFQRVFWHIFGIPESRNSVYHFLHTSGVVALCYAIAIVAHGYKFGADDMTEGLSYARWLFNADLYPKDLYIQSLAAYPWNERTFFAWILSLGNNFLPTWALFLHAIFSMVMLSGLYQISTLFMENKLMRWLSVLAIAVLGPVVSIGGNELYAPYLVPSLMAKGIGCWSVYYLLKKKWHCAFILIIPITFIQPIVGAQLWLISVLGWFFIAKEIRRWSQLLWLVIPSIWLVYLYSYASGGVPNTMEQIISFQEFIRFRMPHHFLWQSARALDLGICIPLFIIGIALVWKHHKSMAWFVGLICLGLIIYLIGIELNIGIAFKTQWLKTTIWLEAISIFATMAWIQQKFVPKVPLYPSLWAILILLIIGTTLDLPGLRNKEYLFGDRWAENPSTNIALKAKILCPKDALIAVPPDDSRFRYASERSIYVDFKSIAHHPAYHQEWYRRMKDLYGVNKNTVAGFNMLQKGIGKYLSYNTEEVMLFKNEGINYWLTYPSQLLSLPIVAQNEEYILYEIPKN